MAKTQDENLITLVLGDSSIVAKIGSRMHFDVIPQNTAFPRIRFFRTGSALDGCLGDAAGTEPNRETFMVEIQSKERREREELRKLVQARLNCYSGTFGDTTCQGIFAADQTSTHEPRSIGTEEGIYIAEISAEVVLS
jgi:hypothetical protein